jgi:hypothetical protein
MQVLFYPGFIVVIISQHILMYRNSGQQNDESCLCVVSLNPSLSSRAVRKYTIFTSQGTMTCLPLYFLLQSSSRRVAKAQPLCLCLLWCQIKWARNSLLRNLLQKTRSNQSFSRVFGLFSRVGVQFLKHVCERRPGARYFLGAKSKCRTLLCRTCPIFSLFFLHLFTA